MDCAAHWSIQKRSSRYIREYNTYKNSAQWREGGGIRNNGYSSGVGEGSAGSVGGGAGGVRAVAGDIGGGGGSADGE